MAHGKHIPIMLSDDVPDDAAKGFFDRGILYSSGRSLPLNLVEAHKWFNLAAIEGNAEAAQHRHEIAVQMSAAEIAAAQRAARDWRAHHPSR